MILDIEFKITYQNETMTPKEPEIMTLPPETYNYNASNSGMVNFAWKPSIDTDNYGSTEAGKASGIAGYHAESSTDPNFAANVSKADVTTTNNDFKYLSNNYTYYFRVYAKDKDSNPISPLTPWSNELNKTSGVRWSGITRTKIVPAPPAGGPVKPVIVNIGEGSLDGDIYYIK